MEGGSKGQSQNDKENANTMDADNVERVSPQGIAQNNNKDILINLEIESTHQPNVSLVDVMLKNNTRIDLIKELKSHYKDNPMFKSILEKLKEFRNFEVKDNLIYLKEWEKRLLCIPKALVKERSIREIMISEAHSMLAHLGANETIHYLRDYVWWKDMISDTKAFCETCGMCKQSKPNNQKPYGLLNPLAILTEPWESIRMDFVSPLPLSSNCDGSFNSITVVICLLMSMVELLPSRTNYKDPELAELMFDSMYKHHGLPKNIISN